LPEVNPEPRFFITSSKTGLRAAERVKLSPMQVGLAGHVPARLVCFEEHSLFVLEKQPIFESESPLFQGRSFNMRNHEG